MSSSVQPTPAKASLADDQNAGQTEKGEEPQVERPAGIEFGGRVKEEEPDLWLGQAMDNSRILDID